MMRMHYAYAALALIVAGSVTVSAQPDETTRLAAEFCTDTPAAADAPKPGNPQAILDAERGTYPEAEVMAAMLKSAAIDIARASASKAECESALAQGREKFASALVEAEGNLRKKRHKLSRKPDIKAVQTAIIDLWVADQAARAAYISLQTDDKSGADYWAQRLSTANAREADGASRAYMQELLQSWDWVDRKRFGNAVSDHAWILVQHADADPAFQQMVLERMEPLVEKRQVRPKHYAYLWDRVAVNTGRKQRFGTQPDWNCVDGKMQLKPLEDPANVNQRRAEMGLNSVEEGLAEMERGVCRQN